MMKADIVQEIWNFDLWNCESTNTLMRGPQPNYSLQRWSNIPDQWSLNELGLGRTFTREQLLNFADWIKMVVVNAED